MELIDNVCEHLSRSDLKNLRLGCKSITASAEKAFFMHISLGRHVDGCARLPLVASSPRLSSHVRIIHYLECLLEGANDSRRGIPHFGSMEQTSL